MDEFIKILDPGLDYVSHEIMEDTITIKVVSNKREFVCPFCSCSSAKKHSVYERSFQDLPIMGMNSKIVIKSKKLFCINQECSHTTFADTLKNGIADVGKSTICNLLKKRYPSTR